MRYIAGKRLLAEKYAAADQPVFAYRFNQPAENGTIDMGVRRTSVSKRTSALRG